jgi:hypothetical protein
MRATCLTAGLALALVVGCAGDRRTPASPPHADSTIADPNFPTLPDSLALTLPGGAALWFSGARVATDSLGGTCIERGLVIVRGATRTLVPLLMTGTTPTLVDDTTVRATIWLQCRPGDSYDVDVRTGTPTRVQ